MDEIYEIVNEAMEILKDKCGTPALDEGDEAVFLLNNCTLFLGFENGELKIKFIGGEPIKIDKSCSFYVEKEV